MRKQRQILKVASIEPNTGQLDWLPKNPRQWTQGDIDRTAKSIEEDLDFLEDRPLLLVPKDDKKYVVFAGNLRREGAIASGCVNVPCIVYTPDTEEDKLTIKRRAMKDNGSFGSWDFDELANSWDDLPLVDYGVPAWEAKPEKEENEAKEDNFNEDIDEIHVICNRGDIWELGEHRLMCGDSIDLQEVTKLMGGGAK